MVESSARRTGHRGIRGRLQFREGRPLDALVVLLVLVVVEGRPGPLRAAGADGAEGRRRCCHLFGRGGVGHGAAARGVDGAGVARAGLLWRRGAARGCGSGGRA